MSHFDKFVLVPNEGPHPFSHPVVQTISELDKDMQSILKGGLDDRSKWRLYEQTIQRYNHLKQQATEPIRVGVQDILDPVPSHLKVRASRLSAILQAQGHVDWSPSGEVSIHGNIIPNTHIGELLAAAVNPRKKLKPTGWNQFLPFLPSLQKPPVFNTPITYTPKSKKSKINISKVFKSPLASFQSPGKIKKRRSSRSRVSKWETYPS